MKLFIVDLTYIVPLETVESHLLGHREFLNKYIDQNVIIVAGRKNPRTGGVIIARSSSLAEVESIIAEDPFSIYKVAEIKITEIEPTLFNQNFKLL